MTDNESGSAGESPNDQRLVGGGPATEARPVLAINPAHDQAFLAAAEALLDDGVRSLTGFQEVLRRRFPDALVRARDLSGERGAVWYVFRDGHWVNGQTDSEPGIKPSGAPAGSSHLGALVTDPEVRAAGYGETIVGSDRAT